MKQHQDHSAKGLFDASQPVCLLFPFVKRHYHGMPRQNYVSVAQKGKVITSRSQNWAIFW